jgi:hypothetical protein
MDFIVNMPRLELGIFAVAMTVVGVTGCDVVKGVAMKEKHAAVAFDEETGGWGYSYNQVTAEAAKKEATKKCSTCKVTLTWNKGCGALAQSKKDKKVMSAKTGSTRAAAEGAAKASCLGMGAGPCKVVVWACNSK